MFLCVWAARKRDVIPISTANEKGDERASLNPINLEKGFPFPDEGDGDASRHSVPSKTASELHRQGFNGKTKAVIGEKCVSVFC